MKNICKSAILLACVVVGILYVASSFSIARMMTDWIRPVPDNGEKFLSQIEFVRIVLPAGSSKSSVSTADLTEAASGMGGAASLENILRADKFVPVLRNGSGGSISARSIWAEIIQWGLFLAFLAVPCIIVCCFLVRPLREYPCVSPKMLDALQSDNDVEKENAATAIAQAMLFSLVGLQADDPRCDDKTELEEALRHSLGRATVVKEVLERREKEAKEVARKYAQMAGLTVALSSSAMGDGLGMFFWKARLVSATLRIYGFRPDIWTVLRIYAYVIFAAFLAATVEDLCELLDIGNVVGGLGARVAQGVLGGVSILKGGQLTRAYLTRGVSATTRKKALEQFRTTAGDEIKAIGESIRKSL